MPKRVNETDPDAYLLVSIDGTRRLYPTLRGARVARAQAFSGLADIFPLYHLEGAESL